LKICNTHIYDIFLIRLYKTANLFGWSTFFHGDIQKHLTSTFTGANQWFCRHSIGNYF